MDCNSLGLLWTMLLWKYIYKFLCRYMFLFLLDIHLELLDHVVSLYLTTWGTARLLSEVSTPFCISYSYVWEVNACYSFDYNHYSGCEFVSHCNFNFLFSNDSWGRASFLAIVSHLCIFFSKMSIKSPLPHFKNNFSHWVVRAHYLFWIQVIS